MSLGKAEISIKAVNQNLEGVLQGVEIALARRIFLGPHPRLRFQPERPQIGKQMPEDLKLVRDRKTIELQHDRWIERGDIAVPDVASDHSEVDGGEATFETAC